MKGNIPHYKGWSNSGTFKKGHPDLVSKESRIKIGLAITGKKHPKWKGENVSYNGLHKWIDRKRGKPHYCEHCKKSDLKHRSYNWANISGNYKRDFGDYIRLCVSCHRKFDKERITKR